MDAGHAQLFEPAALGPVTLRNRIIKAATFDEPRTPTQAQADQVAAETEPRGRTGGGLFRRRARGGLFHRHHAGV